MKDRAAVETYKALDYLIIKKGYTKKQIEAVKREYVNSQKRVARAEENVKRLEDALDIDIRWLPTSSEYKEMAAELVIRKYRRCLDNLERLVVQRLFELKKLGMNGLGELQSICSVCTLTERVLIVQVTSFARRSATR